MTCPICLEDSDPLFVGECNHPMHISCLRGMISMKCPICRQELTLPEDLRKVISDNEVQNNVESAENYLIDLMGELAKISDVPVRMQMRLALKYVRRLGLPQGSADRTITLDFVCPSGEVDLFSQIVISVMKIKRKDLIDRKKSNILIRVTRSKEDGRTKVYTKENIETSD